MIITPTLKKLAEEMVEALLKDDEPEVGGHDLTAGMFGPNLSQWLKNIADQLDKQ